VSFRLDHDVPAEVARVLAQAGHQVTQVRTVMSPESTDDCVFQYAVSHSLVLLTCNRDDFIRLARGQAHPGLVVVIRRRTRIAECASLLRLLKQAGTVGVAGNINFA